MTANDFVSHSSPMRIIKSDPKRSYSPRLSSLSPLSPLSQSMSDPYLYESDYTSRPYLPECWTDSKRMDALFTQFRAREANPEGWDLKMNFWINCINKWSLQTHCVMFSVEDIRKAFERGSNKPQTKCIELVLSHLKRNKSLISFNELKALNKSNNYSKNWVNWGINSILVKPLSFGWSLIANNKDINSCEEILSEINSETKFIHIQTLKVMSEELNKYVTQLDDLSCIRYESLFNKCKDKLGIDWDTYETIVAHLELENKLKLIDDNRIKIIKVGKNADIKETDIGFIRLETAKELLETEIEKLEEDIEAIKQEAKVCVRNKNKEKAILLLKKKKRIEQRLNKKEIQLDNVDVLIDQLLNANSHNLILQAFQKAAEALKLAHNNHEDVENTIADLEETIDVVSDVISEVSRPLVSVDNQDIDNELDELLSELEDKPLPQTSNEEQNDEQLAQILHLNNLSINDTSLPTIEETSNRVNTLEVA